MNCLDNIQYKHDNNNKIYTNTKKTGREGVGGKGFFG